MIKEKLNINYMLNFFTSYLKNTTLLLIVSILILIMAVQGSVLAQTVTATGTSGSCPSSASISATVAGFAGNANMSYRLRESVSGNFVQPNDGSYQTTPSFSGLPAGTYIVDALDQANNVSATTTVSVSETYVPMSTTYTKTDIFCLNASTGQIVANVTGGKPGYTYALSGQVNRPPQPTSTFSNLPAGSYTVLVTDACGISKPIAVTLVSDLINLNNIEAYLGPSLQNVTPGDCSSKQFSTYDLMTGGVQGAVPGRIRISYEYPAGSGLIYGANGILNGPGVLYNSGGGIGIVPFLPAMGAPNSAFNMVLTDDCGNQRILNNNKLPEPPLLNVSASYCNGSITLNMTIGGNACLNASVTLTDNSNPALVHTFNLTAANTTIPLSGLIPGHSYTATGFDATNTPFSFVGNNNQVQIPIANTPVFMAFYAPNACTQTVDPVLTVPDGSAGPISVTITAGPSGTVGLTLNAPSLNANGALQFVGLPFGNYTMSYTSACQSGTISGNFMLDHTTLTLQQTANCSGANIDVTVSPLSGNTNGNPFSLYQGYITVLPGSASSVGASHQVNATGTATFPNLTPGNYIFGYSVYANSCTVVQTTATVTLSADPITVDGGNSGGYVCNNNPATTGTITIHATSSTNSNLYYSIDNGINYGAAGANIFTVPYGANGQIPIMIKDDCGNVTSYTATLAVSPAPSATGNLQTAPKVCQGENLQLDLNIIGASSYTWTGPNGFTSNIKNPLISNIAVNQAGTYQVTVVTSCGALQTSIVVVVNPLPAQPTITANTPTTFCQGGNVVLNSSAATGNQWYNNGIAIAGANGQTYSATTAGDYTVIVTDANTCSSPSSVITTVTVNPSPVAPTISVSGPTTFCSTGSVTLTSSVTTGNQWYKNGAVIAGEVSQTYIATATGTYTVTTTGSNTCVSPESAGIAVNVNALPVANITYNGTPFCNRGTVSVTQSGQAGGSYASTAGLAINATTGAIDLANSTPGTYTITYNFSDGTCSGSVTTNITVNATVLPGILADITAQCGATPTAPTLTDNCAGLITPVTSTIFPITTQGTTPVTWTYNYGNGYIKTAIQNVIINDNTKPVKPILANVTGECSVTLVPPITTDNCAGVITGVTATTFPITQQGTTTVTWTFNDGNGNTETATQLVILTNIAAPTVVVNAQPTCSVATGNISITPIPGATYSLDGSAYTSTTTYTVSTGSHTVTAKSINGCISSATTVTINSQPLTPTATIAYGASQYSATGTTNVIRTGQAGGAYTASPAGLSINSSTGTINLSASTPNQTYTVTYTFSNGNCSNTTTTTVKINSTPATISYPSPAYCATGSATAVRTGPTTGTYSASPGGLNINSSTGEINLSLSSPASYTVSYTYQNGALTEVATTSVIINPLPVVNISNPATGGAISKGDVVALTASGGTGYAWSGADIQSGQNTSTVRVRPKQQTTYTVTVTNAFGCSQTLSVTINVKDDVKVIPNNVITPNGDGKNDTWQVANLDYYPNNTVSIYDRAGRLVYTKKSYNNEWDGTYNGHLLNEDAYIYVIDLGKGYGLIRGTISIIRDKR